MNILLKEIEGGNENTLIKNNTLVNTTNTGNISSGLHLRLKIDFQSDFACFEDRLVIMFVENNDFEPF